MTERLNKVHLIICTIAASIIAIGFIAVHVYDVTHGLFTMAMWVSISIVLFYFIGHMVRAFLINRVFAEDETEVVDEEILPLLESEPGEDAALADSHMELPQEIMYEAENGAGDDYVHEENAES